MKVVPPVSGPEAELVRLSRASGPWLHLLDAAPADARQLGWLLGQDGVVVRQLRGACGRSTYGLLDELGAALQLPGDPVEDWPGLAALLTDMAWLPGTGHVLVVTRASLLLAAEPVAELRGLVDAVREVARARAEEGDPVPFHLVLQDDTVGLAALRARLDSVRARYAALAGWEASEPAADTGPSARSVLTGGAPDAVDLAAGTAASTVDGVRSVGRAWEEFRGGSAGAVRVYVPLLAGPADVAAVAAALAGAAAAAGASCVVVPVPAELALADARQAAVAAAATPIWPEPAPPDPVRPTEAPPTPTPVEVAPSPVTEIAPVPVTAGPAVVPATPVVEVAPVPAPAEAPPVVVKDPVEATDPVVPAVEEPVGPHDAPGARFELIAANLQWPFDTGSDDDDAVDAALLAHARAGSRTAALFRTWVQDPDGSWVRVILGYVNRSTIADVETERAALVDALQRSGAGRCCVEVLAATDVSEAHRWLEQRCRPLWPTPPPPPDPASDDRGAGPSADLGPDPGPDLGPDPGPDLDPDLGPDPGQDLGPASGDDATSRGGPVTGGGTPAVDPAASGGRGPEPQPADDGAGGASLAADAAFTPGPGLDHDEHGDRLAELVAWASGRPGVVGLVTAWAADRLVVGAALDGDTDPDQVRREPPYPVEPFAPARGLDPVHLRLTRGSTRIWTRRAERAAPEPAKPAAGALARPDAPTITNLGPPPTRDTEDARGDEQVGEFVLVGIDRETTVSKGAPTADEHDAALVDWARARSGAVALLRCVTDEQLKVYCVAIEETADPEGTRRDLARAAAAAGLGRAALEAFAPAGAISAFHLDLAVNSTRLWPTPATS